nr:hypothetical protein [Tanacetum cinerariifolium]
EEDPEEDPKEDPEEDPEEDTKEDPEEDDDDVMEWMMWRKYAKSRPNGKLIHNSILNGPYVRRMIAEPGDGERD